MKTIGLAVVCLVLAFWIAGCSTIRGVGEDVKTVGGWMIKGSEGVK